MDNSHQHAEQNTRNAKWEMLRLADGSADQKSGRHIRHTRSGLSASMVDKVSDD